MRTGLSKETLEEWSRKFEEGEHSSFCILPKLTTSLPEINNPTTAVWGRSILLWGRRREGPDLPAPHLQLESAIVEQEEDRYPLKAHFHLFNGPEEARTDNDFRNRSLPKNIS